MNVISWIKLLLFKRWSKTLFESKNDDAVAYRKQNEGDVVVAEGVQGHIGNCEAVHGHSI